MIQANEAKRSEITPLTDDEVSEVSGGGGGLIRTF